MECGRGEGDEISPKIQPWILEVGSDKAPWDVKLTPGDVLILGPEDGSVQEHVQDKYRHRILSLPQFGPVRSLNLAQCAAVGVFEAVKQASRSSRA